MIIDDEYTDYTVSQEYNGGPSDYYDLPDYAETLNDLIEYKEMSFAQGNIFKAAYRLGNKEGVKKEYDLNKIIYFAERMLLQLENQVIYGDTDDE